MYRFWAAGASIPIVDRRARHCHDMDTGYNVGARFGYGLDNFLPMPGWSADADVFLQPRPAIQRERLRIWIPPA